MAIDHGQWTDEERKADVERYLRERRAKRAKPKAKKFSTAVKVARFLFGTKAERREASKRWRKFKSTW